MDLFYQAQARSSTSIDVILQVRRKTTNKWPPPSLSSRALLTMQLIAGITLRRIGSDGRASPLGTARSGAGPEHMPSYLVPPYRLELALERGVGVFGVLVEVRRRVTRGSRFWQS